MATNRQAAGFIKMIYQEVWQSYSVKGLCKHYDKKVIGHTGERMLDFEEIHSKIFNHSNDFSYMIPKFHKVLAHNHKQLIAWFTSIHYVERDREAYRLEVMANYTVKNDKIIRVDFIWDKPVDFVLKRLYGSSASLTANVTNPLTGRMLTQRELECFFHLIQGRTAKDIANKLQISRRTVEAHIISIKNKLNLVNSREIIEFAVANGYLKLAPLFDDILNSTNERIHDKTN